MQESVPTLHYSQNFSFLPFDSLADRKRIHKDSDGDSSAYRTGVDWGLKDLTTQGWASSWRTHSYIAVSLIVPTRTTAVSLAVRLPSVLSQGHAISVWKILLQVTTGLVLIATMGLVSMGRWFLVTP